MYVYMFISCRDQGMGHFPQSPSLSTMKLDVVYRILFLVSVCAAQGKSISMLLHTSWGAIVNNNKQVSIGNNN